MSMPTVEEFRAEIESALPGAEILFFRHTKDTGRRAGITAVLDGQMRPLKYVRWARDRYYMSHGDGATVKEAVLSLRTWLVFTGKTSAVFWLDHMRRPPT